MPTKEAGEEDDAPPPPRGKGEESDNDADWKAGDETREAVSEGPPNITGEVTAEEDTELDCETGPRLLDREDVSAF